MKVSTPQIPKTPQPKSILLIGPPGGGKTTLMLQFPGLVVLDCDENLDGPENYIRSKVDKSLSYNYIPIKYDDDGKPIDVTMCFDRLIQQLDLLKVMPDVKMVAIDSLTMVNEYIIRKILRTQMRTEMEARDWIPFKTAFYTLLVSKLRAMGKHTICTVHESIVYTANPKDIMSKFISKYEPSVQGSIVDFFGAFFTDMWRCEANVVGAAVEYKLITNRTALSDLKNSCQMPNTIVNPTFKTINQYLKI